MNKWFSVVCCALLGLICLFFGGLELYRWQSNREIAEVTCQELIDTGPPQSWIRIDAAYPQLADAFEMNFRAGGKSGERRKQIGIPLSPTKEPAGPARVVLCVDPDSPLGLEAQAEPPNTPELRGDFEGMAVEGSARARHQIDAASSRQALSADAIFVDCEKSPSIWRGLASLAIGALMLVLAGFLVLRTR